MAVRDVVMIGIVMFVLGMGLFVVYFTSRTMMDAMLAVPTLNQTEELSEVFEGTTRTINKIDYFLFSLFIGLILALIISGWFIGGNPLFMFIYFIVVVITVAISPLLSNTWESITTMPIFGGTLAAFPITNHIILNLPVYISVIGIIGMIAMFAKPYYQTR